MSTAVALVIEAVALALWTLFKGAREAEGHFRVAFALCALFDILMAILIVVKVPIP